MKTSVELEPRIIKTETRTVAIDDECTTQVEIETHEGNCPDCGKARTVEIEAGSQFASLILTGLRGQCDECHAIYKAAEDERRRKELQAVLRGDWKRICPPRYFNLDPAKLPTKARESMERVVSWKAEGRGLIIKGETGHGKSFLGYALAGRLFVDHLGAVQVFDCMDFAHTCSKLFAEHRAEDWLERMARAKILFFDDFGKLKMTERMEAELFGLIERRMAWNRSTIFTTNDTAETLAARMTPDRAEPFVRRLREWCDVITL